MPRFTFSAADEDGVLLRSCQIDAPSIGAATSMFAEQVYHGLSRWENILEDDREYGEPQPQVMSAPQPKEGVRWSKPRCDIRTRFKYHFVFKMHRGDGRWYEWEFIGPVLDLKTDSLGKKVVVINFRPDAGTSEIAWDDIIYAEPVSYDFANRLPRRVRGGASGPST